MKTAEDMIKKEFPDWQDWAEWGLEGTIHIMREYAKQCTQDALNRAAENAQIAPIKTEFDRSLCKNTTCYGVIPESISSTEIITP